MLMENFKFDKSIVICALARDCAEALTDNIPRIQKLRRFFSDSEVIVIENDSKDNTKDVLATWQQEFPGVHVISEDYNSQTIPNQKSPSPNGGTGLDRIAKMSFYRNQYIQWIKERDKNFDYVLMIDIDVECFSVEGTVKSIINAPDNWGGLFAYGYTDTQAGSFKCYKIFHDLYAFIDKMPLGKPYLTHKQMFKNSKSINNKLNKTPYLSVVSSFGGLGIYNYKAISGLQYEAVENGDPLMEAVCEHIPFNMSVINGGYQNYVCREMEVYYGKSNLLMVVRNVLPLPVFKLLAFMVTFKWLKA